MATTTIEFDIACLTEAERRSHAALVEARGPERVARLYRTTFETVERLRGDMGARDVRRELGRVVHEANIEAGRGPDAYRIVSMVVRAMVDQALAAIFARFLASIRPAAAARTAPPAA